MENKVKVFLSHGSGWVEHEDYLVGNKQGLKLLRETIDEALDHGETESGIGEFVGVRCLKDDIFENQFTESSSKEALYFWLIIATLLIVFGTGLVTIFSWFWLG